MHIKYYKILQNTNKKLSETIHKTITQKERKNGKQFAMTGRKRRYTL